MRFEEDLTQKVIAQTGSFTGYRPLLDLGHGYLTASAEREHPLCGNVEGWGPLSPFRYDFTPCFIDVWVASVAVFGLVFGPLAVWWLVARKPQQPVPKDAQFWVKQVCKAICTFLKSTSTAGCAGWLPRYLLLAPIMTILTAPSCPLV